MESGAPGRRSGPPTHTPATALACGNAGAGPQGCGAELGDGLTEGSCRLPPKLHLEIHCFRTAVELELHRVPRLQIADDRAQLGDRGHLRPVGLHDDVAAERPRRAGHRDLRGRTVYAAFAAPLPVHTSPTSSPCVTGR